MSSTPPEQDNAYWSSPPGTLVYVGSSMYPTFQAPEIIYFTPYADREVRPGDIVIFDDPAEGRSITHRVISVAPEGFRTRGDNNDRADPWTLQKEDIVGRVTFACRGRRYRRIHGGLYGAIGVFIWRTKRRMAGTIRYLSAALYQKASKALIGVKSRGRPR